METEACFNAIASSKLTADQWGLAEKPLTELELNSNTILYNFGIQTNYETKIIKSKLTTVGEYYYNVVRNELKSIISLPRTSYNQEVFEQNFGKNKKNKIILDNCKKTLSSQIKVLIRTIQDMPHNKIYEDLMNGTDCIEFRILILMKIIEFHSKTNKYNVSENVPIKEELLIASKKILYTLKKIKETEIATNENNFTPLFTIPTVDVVMCNQLIEDLKYKIEMMTIDFNIKLYDIANKRPKLIYNTIYDCTISELKLKLHDTQIECIETIKNNFNTGSLIIYKTLTGLGKTSTILAMASFIMKQAEHKSNNIMLFCCSDILDAVRIQVLRLIHNFKIKFGVCTVKEDSPDEYVLKKSYICGKDNEPVFLVCDYVSTYLILKEAEKEDCKKKYTLFFDEPTVLTDNSSENNKTLELLVKILYHIPKNTILASATFPQIEEFQSVIDHYKNKYPGSIVKEIKSNKTLIGCIIKDFDNNTITPHICCKTPAELSIFIEKIKHYPLLGKFYTLPFLINLNEFLKTYNLNCDLDSIETFEHENIVENILLLLNRVATNLNGNDFEQFLSIKIIDINDEFVDLTKVDETYQNKICPEKFIVQHAFKFFGCCWIASENPEEYVKSHFSNTLLKIKTKMIGNAQKGTIYHNISDCYEMFKNAKKAYKETIDSIIVKSESSTLASKKVKCHTEKRTKNYDALEDNIQRVAEPKFEFPGFLQVNTHEHIKMFSKYVNMYDASALKVIINPEKYDLTEFEVSDELKFLLLMGVAIYSKNICPKYSVAVLDLLQNRQLAFIIAGKEFCYGANYQLSCLILNDELMDLHSIDTILQAIGRTSRIGKSESGRVYLDENTTRRITEFFANPNYRSTEGINISNWFVNYKNKIEGRVQNDLPISNEILQPSKTIQINGVTKKINKVDDRKTNEVRPTTRHFLHNENNQRVAKPDIPTMQPRNGFNINNWMKPVATTPTPTPIVIPPTPIKPAPAPPQSDNDLFKLWGKPHVKTEPTKPIPKINIPNPLSENEKKQINRFDVNLFKKTKK